MGLVTRRACGYPSAEEPSSVAVMPRDARLIVQLPRNGALERRLRDAPGVAAGEVVLDSRDADADGRIAPPDVGRVVLSVPSPEALTRDQDEVRRVIDGAGPGDEPLVVVVEAAEELRDDELAVVLDAADRAARPVVLHVAGGA
jgi:hypothetical protein